MCSDSDVAIMKDWLQKQKHLPQEDDNYIKSFIVAAKGSIQTAKTKYEKFHMLRHWLENDGAIWNPFAPENEGFIDKVFMICATCPLNIDVVSIRGRGEKTADGIGSTGSTAFEFQYGDMALIRLPKKTPEGYSIFISKLLVQNDNEPDPKHVIKWAGRFYMLLQTCLWENNLGDCQMVMINDWTGLKLGHVKGATPAFFKNFAGAMNGGVPLRIKSSHEIGLSPVLEFIINTVNSLIPKKLKQRRFAHSKLEGLLEYVPLEDLPSDYGGKQPSVAQLHEQQKEIFKKYLDKLVKQKELIAAEKPFVPAELSPESSDTFKKLDID